MEKSVICNFKDCLPPLKLTNLLKRQKKIIVVIFKVELHIFCFEIKVCEC